MKNLIFSTLLLFNFNIFADLGVGEFCRKFTTSLIYKCQNLTRWKNDQCSHQDADDKKGISIFDSEDLSLINAITLLKKKRLQVITGSIMSDY